MSSRKQYTKLSNSLQRTIRKHQGFTTSRMVFVDCLTMFCTSQTSNVPGAVHGGRAIPDEKYFDDDRLHLSEDGYRVWKKIVEEELSNFFAIEA
jgi:lysophospholipase L1-like esterase